MNERPPDPPRRAAGLAVVLLHGYLCLSPRAYWRGLQPVRRALADAGVRVVLGRVARTGGVATRAAQLAGQLAALPERRLILVGHSMGGLDARYLASRLDPRRRVRGVITIGAPHGGSAAAEWVMRRGSWPAPLLRVLDRGALADLTRAGALRLDRLMPDRPDVAYRALAGHCPVDAIDSPFTAVARHVADEEGDNDGMVATSSAARWAAPVTLPAHHLGLIGHPLRQGIGWPAEPDPRVQIPLQRLLLSEVAAELGPASWAREKGQATQQPSTWSSTRPTACMKA